MSQGTGAPHQGPSKLYKNVKAGVPKHVTMALFNPQCRGPFNLKVEGFPLEIQPCTRQTKAQFEHVKVY